MRVSTATSSRSDSRVFTVVVQGYGTAQARNAERTITVPFVRLQTPCPAAGRESTGWRLPMQNCITASERVGIL